MANGISAAFVKAQKGFGAALKTATNPHFRSKYADLSACVEAVIDALNSNGIAIVQKTHECQDGVAIETVFIHESGETMSSGVLRVPAAQQNAQGYGSAMTYARRYSLMAACMIAPEDDDGNAAKKAQQEKQIAEWAGKITSAMDEVEAHKAAKDAYKWAMAEVGQEQAHKFQSLYKSKAEELKQELAAQA